MSNEPWVPSLAKAIIYQALLDIGDAKPWHIDFISAKNFINSSWFENIAENIDLDFRATRKKAESIQLDRALQWRDSMTINSISIPGLDLSTNESTLAAWLKQPQPSRRWRKSIKTQ